jgi:hypothetical protein
MQFQKKKQQEKGGFLSKTCSVENQSRLHSLPKKPDVALLSNRLNMEK